MADPPHDTIPRETVPRELDIRQILSLLPHRYPLLLVDRVLEIERKRRIVAIKNVTINEEVLQGHFPGYPLMPGVFLIEGLAQTSGILQVIEMTPEEREGKLVVFTAIDRARFRRQVVPGDQIRYEVEIVRWRGASCKTSARAMVGDTVAAEARLSSMMIDREPS